MSISGAKKCFHENLQHFGDARTQPEKFNLYNGLYQLSDAIDDLERKIKEIDRILRQIR